MVTVIIPALNEERTIRHVVRLVNKSINVSEVIVVDDNSSDNTVAEAKKEDATVVTSSKIGKGTSMKEGVMAAKNDTIVFLDADITTYPDNVVELLAQPLLKDEADFIKSYFTRQAGRVTELLARPLLSLLNPSFPDFKQPLSGMIAGRKALFTKCEFEDDYGVDIGILLDMHNMGVRIKEVCIGYIENKMQPLEQLGKMSIEVARTIIKRSGFWETHNLYTANVSA